MTTGYTAGALITCSASTFSTTLSFKALAWSATGLASTSLFNLTSAIIPWSAASSESNAGISKLQQPNLYHELLCAKIFDFLPELNLVHA